MTITYKAQKIIGLAADTKPANIEDWDEFIESDTLTRYMKIAGTWKELSYFTPVDYEIYKSTPASTTYKARNCSTNIVDITNTNSDIGQLLTDVSNALSTNGGRIDVKGVNTSYQIITPFAIPQSDAGVTKPIFVTGNGGDMSPNVRTSGGVTIEAASTFPTGRYFFETIAGTASNNSSTFLLDGLLTYNSFARSGTTGQNVNGGSTIIDAGILKSGSAHSNGIPNVVRNVTGQYMWRGLHYQGYQYWGQINNFFIENGNTNTVTDCDLIFEKGGYTDYPKGFDIRHVVCIHQEGNSSGTGSVNNAIAFGGGYHTVAGVKVDGTKYNESVIAFKQCFSSNFNHIFTEDLNVAQGAGFKGVFLLDSNDFSGNAPTTLYDTYNNQIYDIAGNKAGTPAVYFNGAFRNRIEGLYAYWGATVTINDTAAGIENVIVVTEGQQPSATPNSIITTTSTPSKVKIVDKRVGAENKGLASATGDGTTKAFTIAHSLFGTPVNYHAYPVTGSATGGDVTVDGTNITITYGIAPQNTASLKWSWYANLYPN